MTDDRGLHLNWQRTFAFAFAAQFLSIVGVSFATPFLPFFVAEVGIEEGGRQAFWAGIVLASEGLTFALFAPFWGILADRHGRKPMVCLAAIVLLVLRKERGNIPVSTGANCGTVSEREHR